LEQAARRVAKLARRRLDLHGDNVYLRMGVRMSVGFIRITSICAAMLFSLTLIPNRSHAQTAAGSVKGQITDPSGAAIPEATVMVLPAQGAAFTAITDQDGFFEIKDIPPGTYTVKAMAQGFAAFEKAGLSIAGGHTVKLEISLSIQVQEEKIVVTDEAAQISVSPSQNASSLVISGKALDALSDDPDELQSDLQALAGPAAGPNGGQIYIDGFTGGQLPPKSSIREIRINSNPFSAEYDHLGYGRIEIFTKPGTDKLHGHIFVDGNSSSFNSQNPFAGNAPQPGYDSVFFHGDVGGPLNKHASYFISVFHRNINDLSIVNAHVLDSNLQPTLVTDAVPNPRTRTAVGPRLDYQIGQNNTLTLRYFYFHEGETNDSIGQFNLASQGTNYTGTEHTVQISDTQTLNPRTINETRFQYHHEDDVQTPASTNPTISVAGAFTGGGNNGGRTDDMQDNYEFQNYTSMVLRKHQLKFGARLRATKANFIEMSGFNGAFTFDSLTAYQITEQGLQNGLTPAQIFAAGGGASQFSLTSGMPSVENTYFDLGVFVQDEWNMRPNLTLSGGLRFETQNQIHDHGDFAPRLGFAWGIGGHSGHPPKTVLRAGWGIFYDRFDQQYLIQAERLNGITQQRYIVTNPEFYPNLPTQPDLAGATASPTIYQVDPQLRAPYTMQTGVSLERQLTKAANLTITYLNSRGEHQFLTRNINAPFPPNYFPADRPLGGTDNIYQYESGGIFKQNEMIINGNVRMGERLMLFGWYVLNYADSDTSGTSSFPSNQYNILQDYGRASYDFRNRLFFGGSMGLPYGFRLSPFLVATSGEPFNITLGQDLNGDSIYNDRPTYATLQTNPADIVKTQWGTFDLAPLPGEPVIPINLGTGPSRVSLNMRLAKTFGFGEQKGGPAGPGGPGAGTFGQPMRGHHGFWGRGNSGRKYTLTIGVSARNLFNHPNLGAPVGVLSSPIFGESNSLAGGPYSEGPAVRRVDLQISFDF
jgi:Carboxypeptidase regulatory-like domain